MRVRQKIIDLNGTIISLRSSEVKDAKEIVALRKITSGETNFMARYPEECDEQANKIESQIEEILSHPKSLRITAFINNQIISDLTVSQTRELIKFRHIASLGISLKQSYCNFGIRKIMLDMAINQAK